MQELLAHSAQPGFVPARKKNRLCTSAVEYAFIEDEMDKVRASERACVRPSVRACVRA